MIHSKGKPEARELSINELDAASGGRSMLDMAVEAAEKYLNGLFGRLIEAVHKKP